MWGKNEKKLSPVASQLSTCNWFWKNEKINQKMEVKIKNPSCEAVVDLQLGVEKIKKSQPSCESVVDLQLGMGKK